MRSLLCSILLCACAADHAGTGGGGGSGSGGGGGGDVDALSPPTNCAREQLSFVTDLPGALNTDATVAMSGYAFANASTNFPGEVIIFQAASAAGTPQVHLYFSQLVLDDHTVPARGVVVMPDQNIDAANCMTDTLQGTVTVGSDGVYSFMVTGLKTGTDCSGAPLTGSFAGCFGTKS